jgi:glycosyltransferase involved in cell wall biosynthesis
VRVVFLTHNYPRWPGDHSGASLGTLARALVRRGNSVRVVAPSEEAAGRAELDGVAVHRVQVTARLAATLADQDALAAWLRRPLGWGTLVRLWRALRSAARREIAAGADVVHAHWWIPAGLAIPKGVPTVLTVHGADAALLRTSRTARSLARPLFHRAAVVTAVSRQAGESVQNLAGRFVGSEHVHPMPIDTRGHPWTRGGNGAVLVGRLDRNGRVQLALETVALLASCGHHLPLTIIGDGPDRVTLQQRAERLGVSALVRFLGPVPAEQVRSHLARADIVLITARGDGNAFDALEALVTGVPVVACWDSGTAVDTVPESGAGRLSLPSAEALGQSVLSLLADSERLAVGRLVGEAWRARLAPDHVAQLCEAWYRDALTR